jgi:hypothetical protein
LFANTSALVVVFKKVLKAGSGGAPDGRIGDGMTVSLLILTSGSIRAGVAGIKGVKDTDVPDVRPRLVRGIRGMATENEQREETIKIKSVKAAKA